MSGYIKSSVKNWMRDRLARHVGLHVSSARSHWPLDWSRAEWSHPRAVMHKSRGHEILLNVPLESIRFHKLHGFRACHDSDSPFIQTIRAYLDGTCHTYAGSELEAFYATYRPANAAAYLQIDNPLNPRLRTLPAMAAPWPWAATTPDRHHELVKQVLATEGQQGGRKLGAADGHPHFGPVTPARGELEFSRLVEATASIQRHGFEVDRTGADNITAYTLLQGNEYRFQVVQGHHRMAALAALEYERATIQLRVAPHWIVRSTDATWWPLVQDGWLDTRQALAIFERIFQGQNLASLRIAGQ